jgi:uncharacterized protein
MVLAAPKIGETMKKYLTTILTVFLSLIFLGSFTSPAFARPIPPPSNYVVDTAGKLEQDQLDKLNTKLETINKSSKNEIAALVVPSMDGENIEDFTQEVFKSWKVGKAGLDNGVLIVIAVAERKSRIQTGSGIEGELTDLQSNDILRQNLNPHLKRDEFYQGLDETIDAVSATLESRSGAKTAPAKKIQESISPSSLVLFILLVAFGLIFLIWLFSKIGWTFGGSGFSGWGSGGGSSGGGFGGFGGGSSGGGGSSSDF